MAWSEELAMPRRADRGGYALRLPITESLSAVAASPAIRLEVSAYEDATLIDSALIDVQHLPIREPFDE